MGGKYYIDDWTWDSGIYLVNRETSAAECEVFSQHDKTDEEMRRIGYVPVKEKYDCQSEGWVYLRSMRKKNAGQVWGVIKLVVHADISAWLKSESLTNAMTTALESAYDRHRICGWAPEEDLPPAASRETIETSIPIRTFEIIQWWAATKGMMQSKLIRALLTEAYHNAITQGLWQPRNAK